MLLRILIAVGVCIFVIFLGFWLLTGGLSRGINTARGIDNPLSFLSSSSTGLIRLPWQPDQMVATYDISTIEDFGPNYTGGTPESQLNNLQDQYGQLSAQADDAKTFGAPSPYRDKVMFGFSQAEASSPASEYLSITASYGNTAPVSMSGWSLQSAVSGIRFTIPQAAPVFNLGALNTVAAVTLNPGASAMIVTGPSPAGISFRVNMCSGYLAELQQFSPELDRACPSPQSVMSVSAEAIQAYGESCIDYVRSLRQCHFPGKDPAPNVTIECKNFVVNTFSYNGCVNMHRNEPDFLKDEWRVYLTSNVELWRNSHDVVRLLDEQGRTVDVLTY